MEERAFFTGGETPQKEERVFFSATEIVETEQQRFRPTYAEPRETNLTQL